MTTSTHISDKKRRECLGNTQAHKIDKEGTMQQNGQEQAVRQPEREGEPNTAAVSAQGEQQLSEEQQKTEEGLDLLRRTQADFVNYRPRMSQEQPDGRIAAQNAVPA